MSASYGPVPREELLKPSALAVGPGEVAKPGVLYLAKKSGCALVPIATVSKSKWNLGIWTATRFHGRSPRRSP